MTEHGLTEPFATQRQLRYLEAVAREAGYDIAALNNRSQQEFQRDFQQLTRTEASKLIDLLKDEIQNWKHV